MKFVRRRGSCAPTKSKNLSYTISRKSLASSNDGSEMLVLNEVRTGSAASAAMRLYKILFREKL